MRSVASERRARIRWTVLLVVWLAVVWGHSMVPGDESTLESSRFVFLVRPLFELFGCDDEMLMTFVIRKAAHLSEYVILLGIAVGTMRTWFADKARRMRALVAMWVLVPAIDETIQRFVPGRDSRLMDVLIDMTGGLIGMLAAHAILAGRSGERREGRDLPQA